MIKQTRDEAGVRGRILFTGTQCQERPEHGGVGYQVTKRALRRFMEQLAYDYASEGVLSNMLVPGILDAGLTRRLGYSTKPELRQILLDRIPIGELSKAEHVAGAFAFLCSADSNYMTGASIVIDGGCVLGRAERSVSMR
jgi:glucose 1-dehydrogenase